MRSRSNGGIIGNYQLPNKNHANGVFYIHDAAIYNTGIDPIWPLGTGFIYTASGGTISTAVDDANYKTHTFASNGTFTITTGSAFIDIFLVGGGGSGGRVYSGSISYDLTGGGGGAGGRVMLAQGVWATAGTTFTVEVGQGGEAQTQANYLAYGTVSDAVHSGKPSKVTSNAGHSFFAYGGGFGGGSVNVTQYLGTAGGGGGELGRYGYTPSQTGSTLLGSYTTAQNIIRQSANGGDGVGEVVNVGGTNYNLFSGGGGAGWEDGYSGKYSTDLVKSSNGGASYYYNRTGYYYGGGGSGGGAYNWPNGTTQRISGLYATSSTKRGAWAYYNQTSANAGDSAIGGYGGGGCGGAIGLYSSTVLNGEGGAGGDGIVVISYRYK